MTRSRRRNMPRSTGSSHRTPSKRSHTRSAPTRERHRARMTRRVRAMRRTRRRRRWSWRKTRRAEIYVRLPSWQTHALPDAARAAFVDVPVARRLARLGTCPRVADGDRDAARAHAPRLWSDHLGETIRLLSASLGVAGRRPRREMHVESRAALAGRAVHDDAVQQLNRVVRREREWLIDIREFPRHRDELLRTGRNGHTTDEHGGQHEEFHGVIQRTNRATCRWGRHRKLFF